MGAELLGVGVQEAHDVAPQHRQRAPQRVALAAHRAVLGKQVGLGVHLGARGAGHVGGAVGGLVDHDHLVHGAGVHQRHQGVDDRADGGRLVTRRQADRDGALPLGAYPVRRELAVVVAPHRTDRISGAKSGKPVLRANGPGSRRSPPEPKRGTREGSHLAGHTRRPRRHGARPPDRAPHRRDHQGDLVGHLRLGPAPVRGPGAVHRPGRHPGPRAHGHRRGGGRRGRPHRARRPRGHPLQHLLRALLHVRQGPDVPVRDHAGARVRHRRGVPGLHQALRPGAGRPGRVPARAAGPVRPDQGARGPVGRPLRLPLRRAAHRVAGGRVRQHPRRRRRAGAGPRPDRRDVLPRSPSSAAWST